MSELDAAGLPVAVSGLPAVSKAVVTVGGGIGEVFEANARAKRLKQTRPRSATGRYEGPPPFSATASPRPPLARTPTSYGRNGMPSTSVCSRGPGWRESCTPHAAGTAGPSVRRPFRVVVDVVAPPLSRRGGSIGRRRDAAVTAPDGELLAVAGRRAGSGAAGPAERGRALPVGQRVRGDRRPDRRPRSGPPARTTAALARRSGVPRRIQRGGLPLFDTETLHCASAEAVGAGHPCALTPAGRTTTSPAGSPGPGRIAAAAEAATAVPPPTMSRGCVPCVRRPCRGG
ncbi:hypothetical protein J2S47_000014 [Streptomyces griseoviridis]|uniref:Uncharacterized protein n=1 Tax=Streptomyces griseoviridis TaxID=45398 RepID=A0ABT9L732_STRGD|nr:hypothetical protein [Streptomyces griseoviridis]